MGIFLRRRDDDSVNVGGQVTVGIRHGLFIVEVGHIPHSPDYMPDTQFLAEIHSQAVIAHDPDSGEAPGSLRYYVLALLHCEKAFLGLVDTDSHDNLVEDGERPCQYIQVT